MAGPYIVADDARRGLPFAVGVGAWRRWDGEPPPPYPEEAALLGPRAAQRRRQSFAYGRAAARLALRDLGVGPAPIGRGSGGEPLWPENLVGTITHSGDLALAMVGWRSQYAGLGVDLEQLTPGLSERAIRLVCSPLEQAWLSCGPDVWRTMLFSAKEAIFKALNPIEGVWLGFSDAELTLDLERQLFHARLRKCAAAAYPEGSTIDVRYTLTAAEVLSTTYVRA